MKPPHRDSLTAGAVAVLLACGILTLWMRDARPLALLQTGILTVAVLRLLADAWQRRSTVWHRFLIPLAAVPLLGLFQLGTGRTAYPWETTGAVLNWTTCLATAFLCLQALGDNNRRDRWLTACALFGIAVSLVAILQLFTSPGRVFWMFDSGYRDLVLGPFVYHNRYAQFVELLMPVALYRAIADRGRAPLWLLGAGIMFAGVVASVSRGGVVLLLLEILAVLACAVAEGLLARRMVFVAAGQIAGVVLVWGTVAGWAGTLDRLFSLNPLEDWRMAYYQSSLAIIRDHALLGAGLSTWPVVYPQYALFDPGLVVNAAHSDWLQWAAEGGFVTLFLMASAVALLVRPVIRSVWGVGFLVVLVHALFDYPMQDAAFALLVFAFAGAIAAEHASFLRSRCRAVVAEGGFPMLKRVTVLPLLWFLLLLPGAPASGQNKPVSILGPMGDAGATNLPGQKVGADDLLAVSVYGAPEFTRTVRVGPDGSLSLPMISEPIQAAGLLPSELEKRIGQRLVDDGILVKPVVIVTVVEYHSRPISVMGAVRRPVTFQSVGRITVLDALARAEGLSTEAGPEVVLTRIHMDAAGGPVREVTRIPVRQLIDDAKPELNVLLTGGEEIRVPEARRFYVVGNVKKPGAFLVKDAVTTTVMKALALAEGIGPFPQKVAYIYRSEGPAGSRREIPVELSKLIDRKTPDVELEPDDVLYVPENRGKRNAITALEKASSFGLATASGVLIWRR